MSNYTDESNVRYRVVMSLMRKPQLSTCLLTLFSITWSYSVYATPTRPYSNAYYGRISNNGPFWNLDIYTTWEVLPAGTQYIYPAFYFTFQSNSGGYMGLQQTGNQKTVRFSLWDSSTGSNTASSTNSQCQRFTHEGSGVMCSINYPWVTGREYRLRIWSLGSTSLGENWGGYVTDMITGSNTLIGIIHLKNTNGRVGHGRLIPYSLATFLEYYSGLDSCYGQPYSRVLFRGPYANNHAYLAKKATNYYWSGQCLTTNITGRGHLTTVHEAGGNINRGGTDARVIWEIP